MNIPLDAVFLFCLNAIIAFGANSILSPLQTQKDDQESKNTQGMYNMGYI